MTLLDMQHSERQMMVREIILAGGSYRLARDITGLSLGTLRQCVRRDAEVISAVNGRHRHDKTKRLEEEMIVRKILLSLVEDLKDGVATSGDLWKIRLIYLIDRWIYKMNQPQTRSVH